MIENLSQNGHADDLSASSEFGAAAMIEQVSIAQTDPSDLLASMGSAELTQPQLIACLATILAIIFLIAWYWDFFLYYVSRRFEKSVAWFQRSTGLGTPALEGGTERVVHHWQPQLKQRLTTVERPPQTEVVEPDEETTPEDAEEFHDREPHKESDWRAETLRDESDTHEDREWPEAASLDDVDATHQNLIDRLAELGRSENQLRSELEAAQQSLELQTAELTRLDQNFTTASNSLTSQADTVDELESKSTSLQTFADSLQQKLDLAESELETQRQQNVTLQSTIEATENESIGLKEQASLAGSLNQQLSALKRELIERNSDLDKLKFESTEAQNSATSNARSLEESQKHGQELTKQLADSKQLEKQTLTELDSARESMESLTADLTQAAQEIARQEEAAERLTKENVELKYDLDESGDQLTTATNESKKLADSRIALEAELRSEKDLLKQTKDEFDSAKDEFDSATLQIADLQKELSSSQAALTKHTNDQAAATEAFQVKLEAATRSAAQTEAHHKDVCKQLESKLAQSADELVSLRDETKKLKSKLDNLSESAAEADALRNQLAAKAKELEALDATRTERETKLSETEAQVTAFEQQAKNAELKLSETRDLLTQEQTLSTELKKQAKDQSTDNAQLADKLAKYSELEANFESLSLRHKEAEDKLAQLAKLKQQANTAELKLSETLDLLTQEQTLSAELKKQAKDQSTDNSQLADKLAKYSELEADFESLSLRHKEAEDKLAQSAKLEQEANTTELKLSETRDLLTQEQTLSTKLKKQANERSAENAQLTARLAKHSELAANFESLSLRHAEVEQNLVRSSEKLEQEQLRHSRLQQATAEGTDELSSQSAKHIELEERTKTLQQQVEEVERKLAASTEEHEQEMALRLELEEKNQRLSADLDRQSSEYSELETQYRETAQASADNSVTKSEHEQQRQKLDDIQMAFDKEQVQRAELLQNLEAKTARVEELEKQVSTAAENEASVDKLRNKINKYKFAHGKNKEFLEELSAKSATMQERASEYLGAAKALRKELNTQRAVSADLQQKLDEATANPSGGLDQAELDRLVKKTARTRLLSLKSQFEDRLNEKNRIISELQNQNAADSNFD